MKKQILILLFFASNAAYSQGKTDAQLQIQADSIRNATTSGFNTALRIGNMHKDIISAKVNKDDSVTAYTTKFKLKSDSAILAAATNTKPSYGDVRQVVSDSIVLIKSKAQADSLTVSQISKQKLKSAQNKVTQIKAAKSGGVNSTLNIGSAGDSVKDDWLYAWFSSVWNALGFGGLDGAFAQWGNSPLFYGAVTTTTEDYTKWVTGTYYNISSAGGYGLVRNSQTGLAIQDTVFFAKVFYIKESGAGTFKMQTSTDLSTWNDVSGYTSISAANLSGIDSLGIVTIPLTGLNPAIRAYGVSGNVKIVGLSYLNVNGGKLTQLLGKGGIALRNMIRTPEQIIGAYLQDFSPDILNLGIKDDDTDSTVLAYQTWQNLINKYAPQCAMIYSSAYQNQVDAGVQVLQNIKLKQWFDTTTVAGEKYFFDTWNYVGNWQDAAFKGLYDASNLININTVSYSGGTVTVTTSATHGIENLKYVRINNVMPYSYNGVYQATVTGANTFTYLLPTAPVVNNGSGGYTCAVDGTHVGASGRQLLGASFLRDFEPLLGLNTEYPFELSTRNLRTTDAYLKTGGIISGKVNVTDTSYLSGSSITTLGGIDAVKPITSQNFIYADNFQSTGNGGYLANGANPSFVFNKTNGIFNQKYWQFNASTDGQLWLGIKSDDGATQNQIWNAKRSGATATTFDFASPVTVTGNVQTFATINGTAAINGTNANATFATQIHAINTNTGSNSLAGYDATVNGVLRGGVVGTPFNYAAASQDSAFMVFSAGSNKLLLTADYTSANGGRDVAIQTRGDKTTADVLISATTGNVNLGTNDVSVSRFSVGSTTKGSIPFPSMTRGQWNAITKVGALFGYDNALHKVLYFDGTNTKVLLDSVAADVRYQFKTSSVIGGTISATVTAATTFIVTIPTQANNTYQVVVQGQNALSVGGWVTNQTTTSFDYILPTAITGTVTFHWILKP